MKYKDGITAYKRALKIPNTPIREDILERRLIGRYTCDAMKSYIRKHPNLAPCEAAVEFRLAMEDGNCYNYNNARDFYAVCEDYAQDIIDQVFYGHRGKN